MYPQKKTHRCFHPKWPQLLSILRWWFCFNNSLFVVAPIVLCLCFIVLSNLLSSGWGIESWLLYFNYVVVWLSVFFCIFPSGVMVKLWSMLVVFLGHTHLFLGASIQFCLMRPIKRVGYIQHKMGLVSWNYPESLRSLKSVSSNVITGASAFPAMSLSLIGNTVSQHEDANPTTESAAVCLKRVGCRSTILCA